MSKLKNYFEQAQLSFAAYAEGLVAGDRGTSVYMKAYVDRLIAGGFTQTQEEIGVRDKLFLI